MSKATILIVEDETIVAADLAGKLGQLGYGIAGITPRGDEAVALARERRPELVLMDIRLAGDTDGIEAAEIIRRDCHLPVVFLTAMSDRATLERAKLTEPFGYILKPFEERELETCIEMALYKHQADRRLREQREWLRVTLTSIGDAVIACGTEGRVTFLNPAAEALTGWKEEEALGQPIQRVCRIIDEHTGQPGEDLVGRALAERRVIAMDNHSLLITKDGRQVPIEDSAAPILDAKGLVSGVVLVFHDVGERRRAQKALRESREALKLQVEEQAADLDQAVERLTAEIKQRLEAEEAIRRERQRLRDVLDMMPAYAILLTPDYRVSFANRIFRERFGEDRGRRCFEFLFGRREPCEDCETYKVLKTGEPHRWEWAGPDGRQYDIYDFPFTDSDGSTLIMEVGVDITEVKLATQALRESEERYRMIAQEVTDVIWTARFAEPVALGGETGRGQPGPREEDPLAGLRFTYFSPGIERASGYTVAEALRLELKDLLTPPSYAAAVEALQRELAGGTFRPITLDVHMRTKDGSLRWFEESSSFVLDDVGRPAALVGIARDITQRRELQRQLAEISAYEQQRLGQQLHDGLGQQLLGVGLLGKALQKSLQARQLPEAETAGRCVEVIETAQRQVRAMIRGVQPVEVEGHTLPAALAQLADSTETVSRIPCTFACDGPVLPTDARVATHLFYIGQEAVQNAVKHAGAGSIDVRLESRDGRTTLSVRDDGRGIEPGAEREGGMGIRIMHHRAAVIGATLQIGPGDGGGTLVQCALPQEVSRHE